MKKEIINPMLVMFCFLTGIATVKAQAPLLPLDSVIARINANPALTVYNAKISAQDAYAAGAKNLDAPKINAGQYMTPYSLEPNMGSFMISGEQMFTNPAKLRAKEDYMKEASKVTAADKDYLKNQLIAQAKQYYYDRVVLEKKLGVLQGTRELLEYMLKDANIRLSYGKEKLSNIYKTKAELFSLDNQQEQLSNAVAQNNIMLNTLMFRDKLEAFSVDTSVVVQDYEATFTDTSVLAEKRSDIRGISRNIELQRLSAKMEYDKRKPDFGIQAGHMFTYGGNTNQYILMASITIPIAPWASKEYKANLKGIRYEEDALQQKKMDIMNQTEGELAALRTQITSEKRQLNNYRENIIPALRNSYKTALIAYDQNTGDIQSVLDGIKDLQAARMGALDRLQQLLTLQVAYEKENEKY